MLRFQFSHLHNYTTSHLQPPCAGTHLPSLFGGGNPDYQVGPEAQAAAYQRHEKSDAHDSWVDVQIFGNTAAHASDTTIRNAASQFTITIIFFHEKIEG